ncbi:pyruvate phosphate dikinase [Candidatus Mancarchaeum acidiphilum]|uniref:Pyruvate phosphate dikinase n=1 Tax=Candidatus Mancarchaeum acidiphilum TaxID=1920749 RepID=A0A218NMR5_9ARCH|nr:PEP/pyruvate-binding domain-containing protein [Candidatus Mancarchaeum acidiphilum]ASI13780.1 pyruvate phosphate dikinase [Candidatus Mancarchaeum acidiphilum]
MGKLNASENIDYIKPLNSYAEPNEVGGKAYNLMKLSHAHYNTVVGFAITTEVYRYWKKNGKLPKEFFDKLNEYLKWFSYGMKFPVIVRSSATVEDAKKASFAGLFASYPNANSILDRVLFTDSNTATIYIVLYISPLSLLQQTADSLPCLFLMAVLHLP